MTTPIGAAASAFSAVLQPDGKIVACGTAASASGDKDFALVRYETDGSLDGSFGSGGIVTTPIGAFDDFARGLVVQPDGKLVAAGATATASGNSLDTPGNFALARYGTDGTLDGAFGSGGIVTTSFLGKAGAAALTLQPDGKLVAAGTRILPLFPAIFQWQVALARYDTAGGLDPTFGKVITSLHAYSGAGALARQADGKLVVAGFAAAASPVYPYDPVEPRFGLARYFAGVCGDGALDPGEACDDHNTTAGDCCSPTCQLEADATPCNDGNSCTGPDTCQSGVCAGPCRIGKVCSGGCNPTKHCAQSGATCPCQ